MPSTPTLSQTVIDNLIRRKESRGDMLRRLRARDRLELFNYRQNLYNDLIEANGQAPISKLVVKESVANIQSPEHIALVPDGNRRWANSRGLTVGEGYGRGAKVITDFRQWAMVDNDTDVISSFLLSTENIARRPKEELDQLYNVFNQFFNQVAEDDFVREHGIRHEVRGNEEAMQQLPDKVLESIEYMEQSTSDLDDKRFVFLMPYGSRDDIITAAKDFTSPLTNKQITASGEDDSNFRESLMLGDLPDVDLMIRTSEQRLSNFMLYENAYSELVFLNKRWPSFTEADFYESIYKYANRDRRFGV